MAYFVNVLPELPPPVQSLAAAHNMTTQPSLISIYYNLSNVFVQNVIELNIIMFEIDVNFFRYSISVCKHW